ncbi:MAG: hypothetical protein IPK83_22605, partial [Planctomycetes bacterium]|nr:hypothetical protein [Planctomycetota bacterium]
TVMPAFGGQSSFEVVDVAHDASGVVDFVSVRVQFGREAPVVHDISSRDGGVPVLGERLALRLASFPAVTEFYDNETPALYVRRSDGSSQHVTTLHGLPLFRERFGESEGEIVDSARRPVISKRTSPHVELAGLKISTKLFEDWRMPIQVDSNEMPFDIRVTGYLPYVSRFEQAAVNGDIPNPAVNLRLSAGKISRAITLFAQDPARSMVSVGIPVEFKWVASAEERDAATASAIGPFELDVEIKNPPVKKTYSVSRGESIKVEGTPYVLTVKDLSPSWPLMTDGFAGAVSPMASVDVTNGTLTYNRTVIQRFPQLSQDIDEGGTRHRDGPYDPNLVLRYKTTADGWLSIVAGPGLETVRSGLRFDRKIPCRAPGPGRSAPRRVRRDADRSETGAVPAQRALGSRAGRRAARNQKAEHRSAFDVGGPAGLYGARRTRQLAANAMVHVQPVSRCRGKTHHRQHAR